MSDDLVKRARHNALSDMPHYASVELIEALADRIEELGAENIKFREAVYIDDLTVTMLANDKKKSLAGIGRALDFLNADMPNEAKAALRSTLAELTGGKP